MGTSRPSDSEFLSQKAFWFISNSLVTVESEGQRDGVTYPGSHGKVKA